jgi:glycosyltransferase involved in cell wall biosynthesis
MSESNSSIFVIPRASTAWAGNEAGWITAAGWASAGEQLWGHAVVATTDGVFSPMECMLFPRGGNKNTSATTGGKVKLLRKFVPEFFITAFKDYNLKRSKPAVWPVEQADVLKDKKVKLVWERHDLFSGVGRKLADKYGVPLVTSVEAPAVWEASKWGVKRPLWGKLLEKYAEVASLKKSDLVSCVSEEVRQKVIEMGVPAEKVIVSHNRVNSKVFNFDVDGTVISKAYNLSGKRVIGWTGSFRKFHGLDTVIEAFKIVHEKHNDTALMLVGDGMEMENVKKLAVDLNLTNDIILPGKHPVTAIPQFLVNFHIGLVSAQSSEGFHYSPLKLREYLATGRAIIAPRAGNLSELFTDEKDLLLYEAGNGRDLADKILRLLEDRNLHAALTKNALHIFEHEGTWLHEMKIVCDKLGISY